MTVLPEMYRRFATEDSIAAAELGGRAAGLMIGLSILYLDPHQGPQTHLEDLAVTFATMAAHAGRASMAWQERADVYASTDVSAATVADV